MYATLLVVSSCIIAQRYVLDKLVHGDQLEFSGKGLIQDRHVWVLITGSLIHATLSHEVNNVLFTFVVSYIAETQFNLSPMWLLSVLTLSGALGWIVSFTYHYIKHKELAYFIPSRGYSPNMVGIALFCAVVYKDTAMTTMLGIDPVIWMLLIVVVPPFFSQHRTHNNFEWFVISFMVCALTIFLWRNTTLFDELTIGGFQTLYFIKSQINFQYFCWYLGRTPAADHACHLGGGITGILMAFIYVYVHVSRWDVHIWTAITRWDFIISFGGYIFRMWLNR